MGKILSLAVALLLCLTPVVHAAQEGGIKQRLTSYMHGLVDYLRSYWADSEPAPLDSIPRELLETCLSYAFYRHRAQQLAPSLFEATSLSCPVMFSTQVQWNRFEAPPTAVAFQLYSEEIFPDSYIQISDGGKVAEASYDRDFFKRNNGAKLYTRWATARAAGWVSSSGSASGTVEYDDSEEVCVGIILRGQRDMDTHMEESGTSWIYDSQDGSIYKASEDDWMEGIPSQILAKALQKDLAKIRTAKKVTVSVNDGKLSFDANGVVLTAPLPADVEVTLAVSLKPRLKVRLI